MVWHWFALAKYSQSCFIWHSVMQTEHGMSLCAYINVWTLTMLTLIARSKHAAVEWRRQVKNFPISAAFLNLKKKKKNLHFDSHMWFVAWKLHLNDYIKPSFVVLEITTWFSWENLFKLSIVMVVHLFCNLQRAVHYPVALLVSSRDLKGSQKYEVNKLIICLKYIIGL